MRLHSENMFNFTFLWINLASSLNYKIHLRKHLKILNRCYKAEWPPADHIFTFIQSSNMRYYLVPQTQCIIKCKKSRKREVNRCGHGYSIKKWTWHWDRKQKLKQIIKNVFLLLNSVTLVNVLNLSGPQTIKIVILPHTYFILPYRTAED